MALAASCPELMPLDEWAAKAKEAAEAEGAAFAAAMGRGFREWIEHPMEAGGGGPPRLSPNAEYVGGWLAWGLVSRQRG